MAAAPVKAATPTPEEIRRICAIANPVIRNLEITHCYYRLSSAFTARTGQCANWCTFATWASKQAGRTIRGEDFVEAIVRNTLTGSVLSHPIRSLWRFLIRKGMLTPGSRLGRAVAAIHSPFDALERASDAVARGNLKVFEEIGFEFARYLQTCAPEETTESEGFARFMTGLRGGDPPEGQRYLQSAFARYQRQFTQSNPALRAQWIFLSNLEIGMHEQTRLQPEIRESLESAPATAEDVGTRMLQAIYPGAWNWAAFVRRPLAAMLAPVARRLSLHTRDITRRVITDSLMMLALPGVTIVLGRHLDREPASLLANISDPEIRELLERFAAAGAPGDCSAEDWADLPQRMNFIGHLFRAFHETADLLQSPFTAEQLNSIRAGKVPSGRL
jgi:hypothetical protein